jgi:hypothetical protein
MYNSRHKQSLLLRTVIFSQAETAKLAIRQAALNHARRRLTLLSRHGDRAGTKRFGRKRQTGSEVYFVGGEGGRDGRNAGRAVGRRKARGLVGRLFNSGLLKRARLRSR